MYHLAAVARHRSRRRALFTVAFAVTSVVPAAVGCAQAPAVQTPAAVVAPVAPAVSSIVRGGVRYNAAAPLDAKVAPSFDAAKPPAILSYGVVFKGANNQDVPGTYVTPGGTVAAPRPTILLLHGLGGSKEQMYLAQAALAGRGFNAFAIDAAGHGKRVPVQGKPLAELGLDGLHTVAGQTIADLRRAVDWLQTRPEVDRNRIGFLGVSLGGILGAVFVSDEPRIKAGVLWAAGGDWGKLLTTSSHSLAANFRKTSGVNDASRIEAVLSDVDPLTTISQVAPRPLLFLNGDKDTVVPTVCTDELYQATKDPKERVTLPGGHIPDALTMLSRSVVWFGEKLK